MGEGELDLRELVLWLEMEVRGQAEVGEGMQNCTTGASIVLSGSRSACDADSPHEGQFKSQLLCF